jgi:hypothetical protein
MKLSITCSIACAMALSTSVAFAEDEITIDPESPPGMTAAPKAAPDPTPAPPPKAAPSIGPQGLWYTDGHVSASESGNFLSLGYFPVKDLTLYGGLGFTYNPNGGQKDMLGAFTATPATDKFSADLVLAAAYFCVDKFPVGMGPEVAILANVAPNTPFSNKVIEAAWALRYAVLPHVALGTDLGISATFIASPAGVKNPTISTLAFGLHIIYVL